MVILALFVRSTTPFGVVWSLVYGLTLGVVISYWTVLTGRKGLSFTLFPVCILAIQLATAALFNRLPSRTWSRGQRALASAGLAVLLAVVVAITLWAGRMPSIS
jgi:hypothetical protein